MKHILAILLAAILLFGCAQPGGGAQAGAGAAAGGTGATGGAGGAPGAATGGAGGTAGGAGAGAEAGAAGEAAGEAETGGGTLDLGAWSMGALIAMGTPVHCTVTYGGDLPGTFDMYVLGEKIMITGRTLVEGQAQSFTEVIKPVGGKKMMYWTVSGPEGTAFENCDWIALDITETGVESEPGSVETTTVDYEQPPVSYECSPAVFGDEKFATQGNVCDFSNIMQNPAAICNQYTGAEREQCLAAFG